MRGRGEQEPLLAGGTYSTTNTVVPVDKYQVAYCIFVLEGLGVLLPWNAFISAGDYFSSIYGESFVFFISLAFNWSGMLCFAIFMKVIPRFSFLSRAMTSLTIFFLVLITIPFLHSVPKSVSMPITLIGVFLTGFASSVMQSTIAGLAALFPPQYMGGMMSGCGVAGVVAILLRVITKVGMPATPEGLEASGKLFFMLAAGIIVVCGVAFYLLLRLPVTQHNLINYFKLKDMGSQAVEGQASFFQIMPKIWKDSLVVVLTLFITLALFPGITLLVKSNTGKLTADWFSILFTGIFMVGDVVGRTLPRWVRIFGPRVLMVPGLMRLAFFPLFVFCIHPHLLRNDWISFSIMALFALSNGYISTLGMIYGPQSVASHERELTGIIMVGSISAGILIGSHFAFLMLYLITGSIGVSF